MDSQELISLYFLDMLNEQQTRQLADWLRSDPAHLEQFINEAAVESSLYQLMSSKEIQRNITEHGDNDRMDSLLKELAAHERSAQTLHVDPVEELPELISNVRERKQQLRSSRHVSRLSLYTALIGLAAMFFAIVYVMMNPRQATQPTATIVDSFAARWDHQEFAGKVGDRLYNTDAPLVLRQGLVKIQMVDGAEVLIQAPARFHAENANQLKLSYGKLTSVVPPNAKGFVVRTPSATIVDYGTEFGVLVDRTGRTEAHVFNGEVELRVGSDPIRHGGLMRLIGGRAGLVTAEQQLETISRPAEQALFVSSIAEVKSQMHTGLRIDLADIVGGGNGFGSGQPHVGIATQTGKKQVGLDGTIDHTQRAGAGFVVTPEYLFVDSVFTPGLNGQPTQVASAGLTTDAFGTTSGRFWGYIFSGAFHEGAGPDPTPRHALKLDGRILDDPDISVMSIHANMGITFDLQQIRRAQPFHNPVRFCARIGLSQTISEYSTRNPWAEFWVLVDGQVRLKQPLRMSDGGRDVDIAIDPSARFLSLAVSEYTDGVSLDWGVFVEPGLELAPLNGKY